MTTVNAINTIEIDFANKLSTAFAGLSQRFAHARMTRRTINALSALSTRELDDLGINRSQIKAVAYAAAYEN